MSGDVYMQATDIGNKPRIRCKECDLDEELDLGEGMAIDAFVRISRKYEDAHRHQSNLICVWCEKPQDEFADWESDADDRIWCRPCRSRVLSGQEAGE